MSNKQSYCHDKLDQFLMVYKLIIDLTQTSYIRFQYHHLSFQKDLSKILTSEYSNHAYSVYTNENHEIKILKTI